MSDAEFSALYGADYFHGEEYRDYREEKADLQLNFRRRLETLHALIPDLRTSKLFEIGCAYGFFLDEVRRDVQSASGIDISVAGTEFARETLHVDALTGNFLEHSMDPDTGVVAMWDTIEHLPRPDLFIEKVSKDLQPGTYLAITTGDIDALNARLRGKRWRMIHPPTHLHYFSVRTLSKLLDRTGFDIVHVSHPGNARNLRSILHFVVDLRLGWKSLYRMISKWKVFDASVTMNLFDIMFVVAKKRA